MRVHALVILSILVITRVAHAERDPEELVHGHAALRLVWKWQPPRFFLAEIEQELTRSGTPISSFYFDPAKMTFGAGAVQVERLSLGGVSGFRLNGSYTDLIVDLTRAGLPGHVLRLVGRSDHPPSLYVASAETGYSLGVWEGPAALKRFRVQNVISRLTTAGLIDTTHESFVRRQVRKVRNLLPRFRR